MAPLPLKTALLCALLCAAAAVWTPDAPQPLRSVFGALQTWACDATNTNQQFAYNAATGALVSKSNGQCVTVPDGLTQLGVILTLSACNPASGKQSFIMEPSGQLQLNTTTPCTYAPSCKVPACCACVHATSTLGGYPVVGWECQPSTNPPVNQNWRLDTATGLLHLGTTSVCADTGTLPPLPLLASYFQDHMVLQRGGKGPIVWGFAAAGTKVAASFAGSEYGAIADGSGVWRVQLAPMAAGGPYTLTIVSGTQSITLVDILIGDVYLIGGQSNAQFTVASAFNATAEIAAANNFPSIRIMTVGQVCCALCCSRVCMSS